MAASKEPEAAVSSVDLKGEAAFRDTIGGIHGRYELEFLKETEKRRVTAVVVAEAAGESWDGGDATPALADGGGAGERGRLRWEAEEDLGEQIVVLQRRRRRRRALAAAHLWMWWAIVG